MVKKVCPINDVRAIPDFLIKKFDQFNQDRLCYNDIDEKIIYKKMLAGKIELETIIIVKEMLDDDNRRNKKYVKWIRTPRCSFVQEQVNKYFYDNQWVCQTQAEKIAKLKNIDEPKAYDLLNKQLTQKFLKEHRQRMKTPAKWKDQRQELTRDRFYYQIERIYKMPYPWCYWDARNSVVQTYFFTEKNTVSFASGGSGSSGQRENHSRCGFLCARCQNKGINIPTHIMVYDKNNNFKYLKSSKTLILSQHSLGFNYEINVTEAEKILKGIPLLHFESGYFQPDQKVEIQIEYK